MHTGYTRTVFITEGRAKKGSLLPPANDMHKGFHPLRSHSYGSRLVGCVLRLPQPAVRILNPFLLTISRHAVQCTLKLR